VPKSIPDSSTGLQFWIEGFDAAKEGGASLGAGQSVQVTSGDPATFTIAMDATPKVLPDGVTPSVASGVITPAPTPAQINVPIQISAVLLNADGSTAATFLDDVTITPGVATTIGFVYDNTVSGKK
jgi:hypothetical protein